jgi:protein arginine kinase activator
MPLNTIIEKARVGCPACFSHFGGQIESTLEGLHRGLQHLGKSGRMDDARARLRADLQTKRALLRSVLRAENYEEAARLRDEIQSLETGLNMAESGAD